MESPADPWLLMELPNISDAVGYPLQCTQRIKYTCFDVSKALLIFGATSGGLYVFNRDPCDFLQLIPNKEGSIIKIKISPQEKSVSFATHKGTVCVCDCGSDIGTYMKSPVLQISKEHQGNEVTFMIWSENGNELYIGDDTGVISVLKISRSFAKSVFQTSATTLMNLNSRIVQIDIKENLLLVSTLTRCFICDTIKEQYAQIGQKLRDGEYGACFFVQTSDEFSSGEPSPVHENTKVNGAYNIMANEDSVMCVEKFGGLKIYSARPGSRIWEVKVNGTVLCTHQFKHLLAIPPVKIISCSHFETENFNIPTENEQYGPQSVTFVKLFMLKNRFLFSFKKDGIYILNPKVPSVILWSDKYTDIMDCKIINEIIYLWRSNGNITILSFNSVEKFLLKCFVNQKFKLCAKLCSIYATSILDSIPKSKRIHLISGLGNKLQENGELELLNQISPVLEEISKIKKNVGQKTKSGIVVIENSYSVKTSSYEGDTDSNSDSDKQSKRSSDENDSMLFQISPDPIQVIKDFGNSVTDKLTLGTKSLKKKWDHLENKMKNIGIEKNYNEPLDVADSNSKKMLKNDKKEDGVTNNSFNLHNDDIVYGKPSNSAPIEINMPKEKEIVELIFHKIRLAEFSEDDYCELIYPMLVDISCDICVIFKTVKELENYMITMGSSHEESSYHCGKIFLYCISKSSIIDVTIDSVIENEALCSYFLQSFININSNTMQVSSCECGFPLPNRISSQTPLFTDIISIFIEKKWETSHSEQCYDICKKVPYMWKKILLLRKNEDLFNILLLILQMLDEELLYSYLPQFTVKTWEKAIKLLITLKKHECLNCGRQFDDKTQKIEQNNLMLSWDYIGALIIKSVGCLNATNILKAYSDAILAQELTLKFYHSCLLVKLFEKYDSTISCKLIDALYIAYEYCDAVEEMKKHLKNCMKGDLPHTALPMSVASKSNCWGLKVQSTLPEDSSLEESENFNHLENAWFNFGNAGVVSKKQKTGYRIGMNLEQTLDYIEELCPNKDCHHCTLPLTSRVLAADGGLWVFSCGHTMHGVCLTILQVKLCPLCFKFN